MSTAALWGGPEDGARIHLPPGDQPARLGVVRMADGALVPLRGRALMVEEPMTVAHGVLLYERATPAVLGHLSLTLRRRLASAEETTGAATYVHRDLVTRWTAQG